MALAPDPCDANNTHKNRTTTTTTTRATPFPPRQHETARARARAFASRSSWSRETTTTPRPLSRPFPTVSGLRFGPVSSQMDGNGDGTLSRDELARGFAALEVF